MAFHAEEGAALALSGPGSPGKALSGGSARPAAHLHGVEMRCLTQARGLVGTEEQARVSNWEAGLLSTTTGVSQVHVHP